MPVGLRQRLVEHGPRKVQPVVCSAERDVVHRHEPEQWAQQLFVDRHLRGHLLGVFLGHRQRETHCGGDDSGDIAFDEKPLYVGRQMGGGKIDQAVVGGLEQRHVDVQHGQGEVPHRHAEQFAQGATRHHGKPEQTEMGEREATAHIDAHAGVVGQPGQQAAHCGDLVERTDHGVRLVQIGGFDCGACQHVAGGHAAFVGHFA